MVYTPYFKCTVCPSNVVAAWHVPQKGWMLEDCEDGATFARYASYTLSQLLDEWFYPHDWEDFDLPHHLT